MRPARPDAPAPDGGSPVAAVGGSPVAAVGGLPAMPLPDPPTMPLPDPPTMVSRCPGCGAVLAATPGIEARHPGASPGCTRLFDITVRGLRDEAPTDPSAAAVLALASTAYDAQHDGDADAVARLRTTLGEGSRRPLLDGQPDHWQINVADVAADLDVVDLPALVRAWAQAVSADWAGEVA